jgi:predicted DNA-binding ribbon-helix-helix protein
MKVVNMAKFMQSLDDEIYNKLQEIAKTRGITIQELIRAVIIPEWLNKRI